MRLRRPHAAPHPTDSAQEAKTGTASICDVNDPVCSRRVDRTRLAHQLCPILEQCREFEVLWATLASGNHDWLGVRRNGEFLVGGPWLSDVVPDDPTVYLTMPGRTAGRGVMGRQVLPATALPASFTDLLDAAEPADRQCHELTGRLMACCPPTSGSRRTRHRGSPPTGCRRRAGAAGLRGDGRAGGASGDRADAPTGVQPFIPAGRW